MSEIKVGDYIRTKQGYIAKITSIDDEFIMCDEMIWCYYEEEPMLHITAENEAWGTINSITKHSSNIIDLIEVGDYVNGVKIDLIEGKTLWHNAYDVEDTEMYHNEDIKSIVTKEQFIESEYKVNE